MPRKPVDQLNAGRSFFADRLLGLDLEYFAPLWHLFTVGHLVATDLDRVARTLGHSFADFDLLGTLAIDERKSMRATDLASALYVSNAVISTRVARLEREGLIERVPTEDDRRASDLFLTDKGRLLLEKAIRLIEAQARIVRFVSQLEPIDQQALTRIIGNLHQQYDREFVGGAYTNS